ncbi:MAG: hypothetical protein K2M97_02645 [Muribaculaceae bacterium]|nr:hypothetical protein [Muribaculaceae bacterium]
MSNRRNMIFGAALIALIGAAVADGQFPHRREADKHELSVTVDSVMQRTDVTRLYCRLIGRPHTSQRIDSVSLSLPDGSAIAATDIDPIYFRRSFQWEDESAMPVELDFPPLDSKVNRLKITIFTPYGEVSATHPAAR